MAKTADTINNMRVSIMRILAPGQCMVLNTIEKILVAKAKT
jgi:hypothetical protein